MTYNADTGEFAAAEATVFTVPDCDFIDELTDRQDAVTRFHDGKVSVMVRWSDANNTLKLGRGQLQIDWDDDGATNREEVDKGTDPFDRDSDEDGLLDGEEMNRMGLGIRAPGGCDPKVVDSDGDGLADGLELGLSHTELAARITPATPVVKTLVLDASGTHTSDHEYTHAILATAAATDDRLGGTGLPLADADPLTWTDPGERDTDADGYVDGPTGWIDQAGSLRLMSGEDMNGDGKYEPSGGDHVWENEDDEFDPNNRASHPAAAALLAFDQDRDQMPDNFQDVAKQIGNIGYEWFGDDPDEIEKSVLISATREFFGKENDLTVSQAQFDTLGDEFPPAFFSDTIKVKFAIFLAKEATEPSGQRESYIDHGTGMTVDGKRVSPPLAILYTADRIGRTTLNPPLYELKKLAKAAYKTVTLSFLHNGRRMDTDTLPSTDNASLNLKYEATYVNGVNTSVEYAMAVGTNLRRSYGIKTTVLYNPDDPSGIDEYQCLVMWPLDLLDIATPNMLDDSADLQFEEWTRIRRDNKNIMAVCHSQGAILTFAGLQRFITWNPYTFDDGLSDKEFAEKRMSLTVFGSGYHFANGWILPAQHHFIYTDKDLIVAAAANTGIPILRKFANPFNP